MISLYWANHASLLFGAPPALSLPRASGHRNFTLEESELIIIWTKKAGPITNLMDNNNVNSKWIDYKLTLIQMVQDAHIAARKDFKWVDGIALKFCSGFFGVSSDGHIEALRAYPSIISQWTNT